MLKFIGAVVVVGAIVLAVGYSQGWVGGSASVHLTQAGQNAVDDGVDQARNLAADGLDKAAEKVRTVQTK